MEETSNGGTTDQVINGSNMARGNKANDTIRDNSGEKTDETSESHYAYSAEASSCLCYPPNSTNLISKNSSEN